MSVPPELEVPSDDFFYAYQVIKLIWMLFSFVLVVRTCRVWYSVYDKLTPVVKAYILVFLPDVITVLNYLPNAIVELALGKIYAGPDSFRFCEASAFMTVVSCVALSFAAVCISHTVLRMLNGTPVSDKTIIQWGVLSWLLGILIATIFAGNHLLGSYKGLYCMLPTNHYRFYGTAPMIVTVLVCFALMCNNYWMAYSIVREAERRFEGESENAYTNRASKVILRNGMVLIGTFYVSWFLVFLTAIVTAVGGSVPIKLDAIASLIAKFQPIVDSIVLHKMLTKIALRYKDTSQVAPTNDRLENALQKLVLRIMPRSGKALTGGDVENAQVAAS